MFIGQKNVLINSAEKRLFFMVKKITFYFLLVSFYFFSIQFTLSQSTESGTLEIGDMTVNSEYIYESSNSIPKKYTSKSKTILLISWNLIFFRFDDMMGVEK